MAKLIGFSNGKQYDIERVSETNPNVGLTTLPEYSTLQWCLFEKIVAVEEAELIKQHKEGGEGE